MTDADPDDVRVLKTKRSGDRIVSFVVQKPDGEVSIKKGTAENILLYEHEMYKLFNTEKETTLLQDPEIKIKPSSSSSVYTLTVNGETILTSPKHSNAVMEGVKELVEYDDFDPLMDVWEEIIESQANRMLVDKLFPHIGLLDGNRNRVRQTAGGWLIDDYYLVDWTAEIYLAEEGDSYTLGGGGVVEADKSHEFLEMRGGDNIESFDRQTIRIGDEEHIIGKKEVRFFAKVHWLLNRFDMLQDKPFWIYHERRREAYLNDNIDEEFIV